MEYPLTVNGIPILQQFYASKYIGVATLTFDETGALTASAAESVPLGTYYSSGEKTVGAYALHACPSCIYILDNRLLASYI